MEEGFLFLKKYKGAVILIGIFLFGVFLRAYHFHDWLLFELDQVRDASMVDRVLDGTEKFPLLGPTMRGSGETKESLFRVGPIYPYFQIFSAKIFSSRPDAMAYPDFLFSVFSIPLLYIFLKKYFIWFISLELTGLYAISFFSIQYSRFAWNPNSIPFFVLLFLISLYEFFSKREKVGVGYGVALGIAIGIGVQLHAIVLVVFSGIMLISGFLLLKKDLKIIKRLSLVLGVAILLNIPQIFSEINTGFSNTKTFFHMPASERNDDMFSLSNISNTALCYAEANVFMISSLSLGGESCRFPDRSFSSYFSNPFVSPGFFLSGFGFILLVRRWQSEADREKKMFVGIILLFFLVSFFSMVSVISSGFREFRYFSILFFLPYVFLGCLFEFFLKVRSIYVSGAILIVVGIFLFFANLSTIRGVTSELFVGEGNDGHSVYLGEVDRLVEYIIEESGGKNGAYLSGKADLLKNIFRPMEYVAKHQGFSLTKIEKEDFSLTEVPSFYISKISKDDRKKRASDFTESIGGFSIEYCHIFGKMLLCKMAHP